MSYTPKPRWLSPRGRPFTLRNWDRQGSYTDLWIPITGGGSIPPQSHTVTITATIE
jgi:hypothetical protein